jgi:hypothetical protein
MGGKSCFLACSAALITLCYTSVLGLNFNFQLPKMRGARAHFNTLRTIFQRLPTPLSSFKVLKTLYFSLKY